MRLSVSEGVVVVEVTIKLVISITKKTIMTKMILAMITICLWFIKVVIGDDSSAHIAEWGTRVDDGAWHQVQ